MSKPGQKKKKKKTAGGERPPAAMRLIPAFGESAVVWLGRIQRLVSRLMLSDQWQK